MKKKLFFSFCFLFFIGVISCSDDIASDKEDETEQGADKEEGNGEPTTPITMEAVEFAAFPGAEGHGRNATGGRGGKVHIVTSLADDGTKGTLRYCIEKVSGARTIVFQVSGIIHLKKELKIREGNLTIAGQTAPGDGICLAGWPVSLGDNVDNVIVRFLRFRMGDKEKGISADGADAFGGRYGKNIIIDHCSMSWCTDECVSFYNNENFTLQWCIISESLRLSGHTKGPHGYGGIWGGMKASFHHNLMANHDSRNPRLGPGTKSTKDNEIVDMRNNVIYNWCGNSCYGGEAMHVNIVNNYYKPGPATPTGTSKRGRIIAIDKKTSDSDKQSYPAIFDTWGDFFIDGNVVDDGWINGEDDYQRCVRATNDNWTYGVYNQFDKKYTITDDVKQRLKRTAPVATETVTTHSARDAFEQVLRYAGCSLSRDTYDKRIVEEANTGVANFEGLNEHNGQGKVGDIDWKSTDYPKPGIIDSQEDLRPADAGADWSAWPVLKQSELVPADTDKDGIPDEFEKKYGLNPEDASDGNDKTLDPNKNYTNLEMYINNLVQDIIDQQNEKGVR